MNCFQGAGALFFFNSAMSSALGNTEGIHNSGRSENKTVKGLIRDAIRATEIRCRCERMRALRGAQSHENC